MYAFLTSKIYVTQYGDCGDQPYLFRSSKHVSVINFISHHFSIARNCSMVFSTLKHNFTFQRTWIVAQFCMLEFASSLCDFSYTFLHSLLILSYTDTHTHHLTSFTVLRNNPDYKEFRQSYLCTFPNLTAVPIVLPLPLCPTSL